MILGCRIPTVAVLCLGASVLAGEKVADLNEGRRLLESGRHAEALKAFKATNSAQRGTCALCLVGMAEAQIALNKLDDAVESCRRAVAVEGTDAGIRGRALGLQGVALARLARTPKDLGPAEDSLRAALAADPDLAKARFSLGTILLRQSRDEEGIAELRRFLAAAPPPTLADQARRLIENPRRARERFAPEFVAKSLAGERVSLESLRGKVVLLDFWATWCGPCREAIPELKDLARKYPPDRLSIVSINVDDEEDVARHFVTKNGMTWTQCHDTEGALQRLFGVNAFPTYLVIDGEGVIRQEIRGTDPHRTIGSRIRGTLDALPELAGARR